LSKVNQYIIGLAGHIDHGKTSIVHSLTGKNTDNLKEEIDRGMTINIGFSFLTENITLIDVPGHEKFIKNMLAGVNSIDYALLVIAADDGIMPQTVEHFEILKLLNITKGSIILNKVDLVDKDWLLLVENEIKDFVKETFLENTPIHKVSTKTNSGVEELKNYLIESQNFIKESKREIFRLFVDRSFISKGFGTVVTGTVISGNISVGDKIKILPYNKLTNIRGLQTHDKNVNKLNFGDRGAINFQSIDKIAISRGNHISDPDHFSCYEAAYVSMKLLSKSDKSIKNNERIRIYSGTQEVMARIFFANKKEVEPGEKTCALLKFEKPIVLAWNDVFIIRTYSPLITVGGGKILDLDCYSKWKDNKEHIINISTCNNKQHLIEKIINSKKLNPHTITSLENHLSLTKERLMNYINKNTSIKIFENNWVLTKEQLIYIENKLVDYFDNFHLSNPHRAGLLKEEILNVFYMGSKFLDYFLKLLCDTKKIKLKNNLYNKNDFEISLSKSEIELCEKLIILIDKQKFNSSSQKELLCDLEITESVLKKILTIEINNNNLVIINGTLIFSKKNIENLINDIKKYFTINDTMDIGAFKKIARTTRKYAVPLLEYFDKCGLTYRQGNLRKLNE